MLPVLVVVVVCLVSIGLAAVALFRVPVAPPGEFRASAATDDGAGDRRPVALFVGDSFTAGVGASASNRAWSCVAAQTLDWVCNRDAEGGTGFVNDGRSNQPDFSPLPDRLDATAATYLADVVVIDAGRNDMQVDPTEVGAVADAYLARVRERWPDAALVLIRPAFLGQVSGPDDVWGQTILAQWDELAARYGGVVLDPIAEQWVAPEEVDGFLSEDGVHPNDAGHERLAERFVADVRRMGLADPPVTDRGPA
ncbi:Lysophospholipase L1 [Klenkia soli]|uniref:Lysophospholipase L1 n=1 Tax=Klenkia soli TaxID=1052260 RepID=A0A1H0NXS8_9ACTN|nr:SGNH/GDSL hydrolase family protein [Klenkia soli]SDO97471.1 Lysophospholipase L1 [Klenkia soli]